MRNQTSVTEFLLLGLSKSLKVRPLLFGLFSVAYTITLVGNSIILMLIWLDSRLHTPMYFFLSHLACVDICYTSSTVPQMLVNLQSPRQTISLVGCAIQMHVFLTLAITECILLAVMAYDRYVAICHPLHYTVLMNKRVCMKLAMATWIIGLLLPVIHTVLTWRLPFCGPNLVDHFFCEMPALLKLACANTKIVEKVTSVGCIFTLLIPISFIMMTYIRILASILKIQSVQGQHKAFSTCASHMTVVVFFYGSAIFMYMRPKSSHSADQDKIVSLFYSIVTPMFNPMIYSLRNKEVIGALIKMLQQCKLYWEAAMGNQTSVTEFLLLGLSKSLKVHPLLFGLFSVAYTITLVGNSIILMLIWLDSRLHTPMYFFLSHLACVDICYTSSTVPQMLVNLQSPRQTISLAGCVVQMYVFLALATTECILLAVMAYDRYVAICHPLHYTVLMNKRVCMKLAMATWISGLLLPVAHTVLTWQLPFCGPNLIDHFFCEMPALLKLACANTKIIEKVTSVGCIFTLLIPISFIMMTYIRILASILKIQSAQGQHKAFSTCASHMTVVLLFYGSAIFMYMRPKSSHSADQDKMISLFYSIVIPLFNPIIYSLKNRDVKGALIKILPGCKRPC
ncbi:uncharacterized protein LOC133376974 [Rhineura floridana]|uniref:uncharacterized protein LOC133376974 n=1 Tax=Rhineura floridana TaxID=261503 RepID=UPI002AC7F1C6|nr:uncharacterized protein LOC133376974 [Rhineura floridana]